MVDSGRWVRSSNKTTISFTDVNNGLAWSGGSSGSLDITSVFTHGTDHIVGLGAHNGQLIIFCKNSIVIYDDSDSGNNFQGTISTTSLRLVEVISGVGCISPKSIQSIGTDILFLDSTGIRSLSRVIQEKSMPLRELSKNVRTDLISDIAQEEAATTTKEGITAVYSPLHSFYLLAFPSIDKVYCLDTRGSLEDGSFRVTTWASLDHTSYIYDWVSDQLIVSQANGLAEYFGYTDNSATYPMTYYSKYLGLNSPAQTKILKRATTILIGPTGQNFVIKIGVDYKTVFTSYAFTLTDLSVSEYNIDEYGSNGVPLAEYNLGTALETVQASIGGSGVVAQVGFETTINGGPLSLQKLDIYAKMGRIL